IALGGSWISPEDFVVVTKTLLDDAQNGFKNGNFVCSPLSLETILGMLVVGAEGETLKQLLEFLGHESIDQLISESQTQILSGVDVSLANGVWVEKRGELEVLMMMNSNMGEDDDDDIE
ncbi:serpin-ZX, partial [Tanacetum coccineum]